MAKSKEDHIKDLNDLVNDHKNKGTRPKFEDLIPEHQELIKEALEKSPHKGFVPANAATSEINPREGVK